MKIYKVFFDFSEKYKHLLLRIFPKKWLLELKKAVLNKGLSGLNERTCFDSEANLRGINLIGNIRAESGLGQSCRLLANELEHTGLEYGIFNFVLDGKQRVKDYSFDYKISEKLEYNINIFHINPYELGLAYIKLGKKAWDRRYNIAFWLWELEEFPEEWVETFALVDEIWTPSEFASKSIRKKTNLPVRTVPYCVTAEVNESYNRSYFSLPEDKFLFLVMYDCNSTIERKNPMGAIKAFKQAFAKEDLLAGIILKVNNADDKDLCKLEEELQGYENVYFFTETMSKIEVNSLIKCSDVFVSLHRAEGFGLVLTEAMLLGIPCIATNWSSNTEFMNNEVACMVDYTMTVIKEDSGTYKKGYVWAEPSIPDAARYMEKLHNDKDFYEKLRKGAYTYISEKFKMENIVNTINQYTDEIYYKFSK